MGREFDLRINLQGEQEGLDAINRIGTAIDRLGDKLASLSSRGGSAFASIASQSSAASDRMVAQFEKANISLQRIVDNQLSQERRLTEMVRLESEKRIASVRGEVAERTKLMQTLRGLSQLGGMGGGYGISSVAGGAGLGAAAGAGAIFGGITLIKNASDQARQLQNLADEMGITAQQAMQLKLASNLAGVEFGTMAQAARRLSIAIEEPGGAGKKTAEALTKLGVSINQDLGGVEETIHKLASMEDIQKRNALASEAFGRSFLPIIQTAKQLDSVGQSLDENVQQRLLKSQQALAEFGNEWTIWKGKAAAAILDVGDSLKSGMEPLMMLVKMGSTFGTDTARLGLGILGMHIPAGTHNAFSPTIGPFQPAGNVAAYNRTLSDNGSKTSLDERIANAKSAYEDERERALNLGGPGSKASQSQLDEEEKKVNSLRSAYEKLEAQKKAAAKKASLAEGFPEALRSLREKATTSGEESPIATVDRQRAQFFAKYSGLLSPSLSNPNFVDSTAYFGVLRQEALNKEKAKDDEKRETFDRVARQGQLSSLGKSTQDDENGVNPLYRILGLPDAQTIRSQQFDKEEAKKDLEIKKLGLQFQSTQAQTSSSLAISLSHTDKTATPNSDYEQELSLAKKLYDLRLETAATEQDVDQKRLANLKAYYEYAEAQDTARAKREEAVAQQREQEIQTTRSLFEGLFSAAISGQPGAGGNFLRGFGSNIGKTIVGNFAQSSVGSLNKYVGLGRTGALGADSEHPNFLGNLLKGTPLGFGADDQDKTNGLKGSQEKLKTSNDDLRSSVDTLTATLGGTPPATSSGSAATSSVPTSLGGLLSGGGGSLPGSMISAIGRIVGGPGGTSGTFGPVTLRGGGGFGGFGGFGGGSTSSIGGDNGLGPALPSLIPHMSLPNLGSGPSGATTAGGLLSKIGSTVGTVSSGQALNAILYGGTQNPDGSWSSVTGGQQAADAVGLGAAGAGGVITAINQFNKGGARGIVGGIGASLGTAAMFDPDPLTHSLLAGGGALAGLISSLFPDPRQQRIKQQTATLAHDAFVQPAQRDYDFSGSGSGGGGFNYGDGGMVRSGGQNANYTINFAPQAMDAKSFVDWTNQNPQAMAQAMLLGLTSGGVSAVDSEIAWRANQQGFFG